ncbi:MAG: PHP domain-containing protein [Marinilabiliaceae bacterium]|nr:PHP domain-containing protein [Marinilabiliaceae bacterium]
MRKFRADLHIHTVLSPCGSLEMSPEIIINKAIEQKLDFIGITDHNTMRQCNEIAKIGNEKGIVVLKGVEIATREEVHCLAFFENNDEHIEFQKFLDDQLPDIKNKPEKFGFQVWVNRHEKILGEEHRFLLAGLKVGIDEIALKIKELNGLFIPAHIDRHMFSITSQLGFIDSNLPIDALEISPSCNWQIFLEKHPYLINYCIITSSDAHVPELIGSTVSVFEMENISFAEIRKAFAKINGRNVKPEKWL